VVGPLDGGSGGSAGASAGASVLAGITGRFSAARSFDVAQLPMLLIPALSLAVLLSIDTLKTCVVVDALTRSRHNSNRELVAQGLGNFASTLVGGVPGAGTMGATLVNISSGAQTRLSGTIEGAAALVAFLALGAVLAWIPIAALAGILIVVGVRMFDKNSLHLLRSRATILDFVVIVSVVVVAETVSLIAASGVGVGLAILLFIREQVRSTVVRRRTLGNQIFSKQVRLPSELEILETRGERTAVFELQGSLFFGTTDQLYSALEADLRTRTYVILDMHRVRSVDVTAAHMLEQVADTMRQRPGELIFSGVPRNLPGGRDLARYLEEAGLSGAHAVRTVGELDEALEWVEERLLAEAQVEKVSRPALELHEIDLFTGRKAETLAELEALMTARRYPAGERIFGAGDTGDELFLVRRGAVRIVLPIGASQVHHLATFRRGDFFGEMAFLDRQPRSANAVAERETDLYVLSRARFDTLAEEHKRLAIGVLQGLARTLAIRLRHTNTELRALQEA